MCDVSPSPAFKWSLILLIPLTFIWKLVGEQPALHEMQEHIVRFLTVQGFNITEQMPVKGVPITRATKGDCSMIVAEAAPDGSTRDMMRHLGSAMDQHFVVFRGTTYEEQPVWLTVTEDWWTKYLRKVGLAQPEMSPIMVAATSSCAAKQLPWSELPGKPSSERKN